MENFHGDFGQLFSSFLKLWEVFLNFYNVYTMPLGDIAEKFILEWFDKSVEIPIEVSLYELTFTPILAVLICVGSIAFLFRIVKDIVNPFN